MVSVSHSDGSFPTRELQTNFDELEGCLCRLPQHRPLTRSKMPRLCLRGCCLLALLVVGSEQALGSSQLQVVASARDEQLQKTAQEKEELRLQHSCLFDVD